MEKTEKVRIYLETSVIGDICDDTARAETTREFFRIVTSNTDKYELVVSPILIAEINKSPEPQLGFLTFFLDNITITKLPYSQEAENLALLYVSKKVLSKKHLADLTHIAYAVVAQCDYILSWDKHFVRANTMSRVRKTNEQEEYQSPFIVTPEVFTGESNYVHD